MDSQKRKRNQGRIRVRKHRAIAKYLKELELSSSSDTHNESFDKNSEAEQEKDQEYQVPRENISGPSIIPEHNEEIVNEHNDLVQTTDIQSSSAEETIHFDSDQSIQSTMESSENNTDESQGNIGIEELGEDLEIHQLRKWAVEHKICQSYLDELLQILRRRLLPTLPKTAKTFLKTVDAKYNIVEMEDVNGGMGEFVYFGIEKEMVDIINPDLHTENKLIELQVNIDAVPLTNSGSQQFTPILCKIHYEPDIYEAFAVAIYYGHAKPKSLEIFLEDFVNEVNRLQKDGINISDTHFDVKLKCFICDTPARAFLKNILGHGGLYACERCTVKGVKSNNRIVYPSVNSEERTDESFRNRSQPEHHHLGPSPLTEICPPLNMVSLFILDFMHLCCIGVMKKLLEYWLTGNLNFRMDRRYRSELSRRMEYLKVQVPSEFQRKPRSTYSVAKWKATEFRFFLLYCGPIVLKDILRDDLYNHFLLFFVACRILCSEISCIRYRQHAKNYLRSFFVALRDFYGPDSQIMNCHNLIHLADDVENMGCSLNRITAFPFESMLGKMKSLLRTAYRPLSQLCRRLYENKSIRKNKATNPPLLEILAGKEDDVKIIRFKSYNISDSSPDNFVILEDKTIIMITKLFGNLNNFHFEGQIWKKKKAIFTYPTNSVHLKMWEMQKEVTHETVTYPINDIAAKLVKLSLSLRENTSEKTFVIPLIH